MVNLVERNGARVIKLSSADSRNIAATILNLAHLTERKLDRFGQILEQSTGPGATSIMATVGMPQINRLKSGPTLSVIAVASELGCDPELVFKESHINHRLLLHPDNTTGIMTIGRGIAAVRLLTGREGIGILASRLIEPADLGLVGFLTMEGPDAGMSPRAWRCRIANDR